MGFDHSLYLGPYFWCSNPRVQKVEHRPECSTPGCPKTGFTASSRFCPACGAPAAQKPFQVERKSVDADQAENEFRGSLRVFGRHSGIAFRDFDVFVPNRSWAGGPKREVTEHFVGEERVGDFDPKDEKSFFEMAFFRELAHLRMVYGGQNVYVRWGLLGEDR